MSINPIAFFIALFVGFLFAYITTPTPEVVIKMPTPDNAGKVVYEDDAGTCYKYRAKQVKCPKDKKKIEVVPYQHVDVKKKENEGLFSTLFGKMGM